MNSSIECLICKRNCKKRAVQCDYCDRWLHYYCEKLTEDDVKMIENRKDYSYNCKMCKASNPVQHELVLPALPRSPENTIPKTLTESTLSDLMRLALIVHSAVSNLMMTRCPVQNVGQFVT